MVLNESSMKRFWKILIVFSALAGAVALPLVAFISFELWSARAKLNAVNVTAILAHDRTLNLNAQFRSRDICVLPAEVFVSAWVAQMRPSYKPVENIDPDSSLYWAVLVFDETTSTYRYLIVNRRTVELDGEKSACSDRLILKVKKNESSKIDSRWLATIARWHSSRGGGFTQYRSNIAGGEVAA